jgi:histidinol-phosphate aminotransferase
MPAFEEAIGCSGFSRRSFFRLGATALASVPILGESHFALAERNVHFAPSNKGIHIDANENPLGPCEAARKAIAEIIPRSGRYLLDVQDDFASTFARQEGFSPDYVTPYAGSSTPLHYAVLAFTGNSKPLVIADPGYEAPVWAAKVSGAPVIKVPRADPMGAASHDIRAMVAAASNPGVIYICNPNNPTGTCTSRAEMEYAVAHAPKGAILLIDEAYIHLSDATPSLDFVKDGKDVIVLRTFSKLYGMAGLRMGMAIGRPDLLEKIGALGGLDAVPVTAVAAAKASLMDAELAPARKKLIGEIRTETLAWLKGEGFHCTPSESNCFMLDVRRPGKEVQAAMAAREVYVGRMWPVWPTQLRVTVGTREEMAAFRSAFSAVMAASTAGVTPLPDARGVDGRRMARLS